MLCSRYNNYNESQAMQIITRNWTRFCFYYYRIHLSFYYMGAYNPRRKSIIIKMSVAVVFSVVFCSVVFFVAMRPLVIDSDMLLRFAVFLLMLFSFFLMISTCIILMIQGYRHREEIIASGDIVALLKDDGQPTDDIPHFFRSRGSSYGFQPYYVIKKNTSYQGWLTPLFSGVCASMLILLMLGLLVWVLMEA